MGQIFYSGAFVQQCFAVHPLCLNVKRFEQPERLVLSCTSCKLSHRVTVRDLAARVPAVPTESGTPLPPSQPVSPAEQLASCMARHAPALSVRVLDVVEEQMGLRCAECRRIYDFVVPTVETHQR